MLKDDLYNHLLKEGYTAGKRNTLELPKGRTVSFTQEGDLLVVNCNRGVSSTRLAIYNINNGKYFRDGGDGTVGFFGGGPLSKLDADIREFLGPTSISFILALAEETENGKR